jgi:hypothetical protein
LQLPFALRLPLFEFFAVILTLSEAEWGRIPDEFDAPLPLKSFNQTNLAVWRTTSQTKAISLTISLPRYSP